MTPTVGTEQPGRGDVAPGAAWDRRYAESEWPREPDAALVELAGPLAPGRAVDLGCGPGRNAIWLARQGWTVTGVDMSAVALAQAGERASDAVVSLELVQADVLTYVPPVGSVDLVVVANLHFPPGVREGFFARTGARLAPGGHLYVAGHHLESGPHVGPHDPARRYTEDLLADLLAPLVAQVWRRDRTPDRTPERAPDGADGTPERTPDGADGTPERTPDRADGTPDRADGTPDRADGPVVDVIAWATAPAGARDVP